jgi:hypothetical protein
VGRLPAAYPGGLQKGDSTEKGDTSEVLLFSGERRDGVLFFSEERERRERGPLAAGFASVAGGAGLSCREATKGR